MKTLVILTDEKPNRKIIHEIENTRGWFIEWGNGYVKLSADTENRMNELEKFFRNN